jgi:DNA repair protein RadA
MILSKKIRRISTGSKNLDDLLLGGMETHAITEFYGPYGTGKSQICYTLSVISAQRSTVIYVDTEAKFRPERLATIARTIGLNIHNANWLSNILYVKAMTTYQQEEILKKSVRQLPEDKLDSVSLLIVDSMINNYRAEFLGPCNLAERQQRLYQLMKLLSDMAKVYGIAVVITNHVNSSHSCNKPQSYAGGSVMAYSSDYRICLQRNTGDRITATIVKSPYHLGNKTNLKLSEKGIEDI